MVPPIYFLLITSLIVMNVVLAFDVSSVSTGFAVLKDGNLTEFYGLIELDHKTHGERLTHFESRIKELLNTYNPTKVVIEEIWRGPNAKTFKVLAYYHGVFQKTVFEWNKVSALYLAPSEARQIVGAKFKVSLAPPKKKKGKKKPKKDAKELTFDFIKKKYKFTSWKFKTHNDITDAICLGLAGSILDEVSNEKSV